MTLPNFSLRIVVTTVVMSILELLTFSLVIGAAVPGVGSGTAAFIGLICYQIS